MSNFIIISAVQWHDDVMKWKHFPRYWPAVRGIHRSSVNSSHKGQWQGALMFSLICAWTNSWVNNRDAGDLRRHCTHYDVTVIARLIPGHQSYYADADVAWLPCEPYTVGLRYITRSNITFYTVHKVEYKCGLKFIKDITYLAHHCEDLGEHWLR